MALQIRSVRLQKECKQLRESPPEGVSCWPEGDDLSHFSAVISGDEDTVYAGGIFKLDVEVPERYPFQPPRVRFLTKIYHPNIDSVGRVCLDVLKVPPSGSWRPMHNLASVLTSIRLLMASPNPDDPLMKEIGEEYMFKKSQYESTAREWTLKFAKGENELDKSSEAKSSASSPGKRQLETEVDSGSNNKKMKT